MSTTGRPIVLVLHPLPDDVMRALADSFEVRMGTDRDPDAEALASAARDVDALVPTVTDVIPASVFAVPGRRLRIVANFGVGVDLIDLAAAHGAGVTVTNTPDVLTDCTADLTVALMAMVLRRLGEGERMVRANRWTGWRPVDLLGRRISGRALGVIGMGRIGRAVARRAAHGFDMRVLYHTRTPLEPEVARSLRAEPRPLDDLLREADVVSLHCPLTEETRGLLDAERLGLLRPDAVLINTARGALVDEDALVAMLADGRLAGAGLDVFGHEPWVPARLLEIERVVVLPHMGSATWETRTAMGMRVVENLRAFFQGVSPPDVVRR
jgi:lactate dehydrogenase-like 2-hydroxyacid dehydrogenase